MFEKKLAEVERELAEAKRELEVSRKVSGDTGPEE